VGIDGRGNADAGRETPERAAKFEAVEGSHRRVIPGSWAYWAYWAGPDAGAARPERGRAS
ncbi:MAG TPA: hypothetical protein PLQ18_08630, partial [Plasticicumulans sp.]|nr:hypothetical protein [Plasticicumulans sp.]